MGVGNWGRWGAEDQRGALNLITDESVKAAAARRRTGKVYSLAIPLTAADIPKIPDRPEPMRYTLSSLADADRIPEFFQRDDGTGANEDVLVFASHAGTHMDALSHVVHDATMYNGFPQDSFTPRAGAGKCGIEHNGSFAGPAKLLDVAGHLAAKGTPIEPGQPIGDELLTEVAEAQGTTFDPGDILLVRTGWVEHRNAEVPPDKSWMQPGLSMSAVDFIDRHDISAVGADNSAVEMIPFDQWKFLTVHIALLQQRGVTLLEHLWLADLAADRAHDVLLAVGALKVTGATGSPINPIAIG